MSREWLAEHRPTCERALALALTETIKAKPADPIGSLIASLQRQRQQQPAAPPPPQEHAWTRPSGQIHKMTLAVSKPAESVAFCVDHLGCVEVPVPDRHLAERGIAWVRLPGGEGAGELHFIPAHIDQDLGVRGGIDLNNDGMVSGEELVPITQAWFKTLIDALDENMKTWTVFMNTHCAWCVDDLTPVVLSLQKAGVPFFGPTLRADGVRQLYVEVPTHHYVEIDSNAYDESATGIAARPWSEVAATAQPQERDLC